MTALVVEGVSIQDLDELDETRCSGDTNAAVVICTHPGCTKPTFMCANHHAKFQAWLASGKFWTLTHSQCGHTHRVRDLIVRPI